MRVLAVLFTGAAEEVSIGELADRAEMSQSRASKEVQRLVDHGLAVVRRVGRTKLVAANWELPWAPELRSILMQTVGVLGQLGAALRELSGVECAYVFGSWAARYRGEVGFQPADIDVLVVGDVEMREVRSACRTVQEGLRVEVNPVVVALHDWNEQADPFLDHIKGQPLVPIALEGDA